MEFSACLCGKYSTMAGMAGFFKTSTKKVEKSEGKGKRIAITMRITCHTCHWIFGFGLGKRFKAIATCHRTCHGLGIAERAT
jgi:hypothetical protein